MLTELGEDGGVTFEAEWRTREDLERHLLTRAFRTVLAVMELAAEAPRFEVDELDTRRGFDFVEEVLGVHAAAGAAALPPGRTDR